MQFAFRWVGLCSEHLCPGPRGLVLREQPPQGAAAHSPNCSRHRVRASVCSVRGARWRSDARRGRRDGPSMTTAIPAWPVAAAALSWSLATAEHEAEPGYLALAVLALARLVACSPCDEANGFIQKKSIQRIRQTGRTTLNRASVSFRLVSADISPRRFEIGWHNGWPNYPRLRYSYRTSCRATPPSSFASTPPSSSSTKDSLAACC